MKIHLVAVGNRMPRWVSDAFGDYAKRFPPQCRLQLIEVSAGKRTKGADIPRLVEDESRSLLGAVPAGSHCVALERTGREISTGQLAERLQAWLQHHKDVALLVGGPDGLSAHALAQVTEHWSLSRLTLAHPLVRIVVAEQLYRAWSIVAGHPYHRGCA